MSRYSPAWRNVHGARTARGPAIEAAIVVEERDDIAGVVATSTLDAQQAAGAKHRAALLENRVMVGGRNPVQDGPAHDDIEGLATANGVREVLRGREHERLVRLGAAARDVDHRRLRLEADHVTIGYERSHLRSEVAGTAPDVEHPVARTEGRASPGTRRRSVDGGRCWRRSAHRPMGRACPYIGIAVLPYGHLSSPTF